jgi:hypothetical protein
MTTEYVFHEPESPNSALLEDGGQYSFTVAELTRELYTSAKGNAVLGLRLAVGPEKVSVFDNPSAGESGTGKPYDNIASFLRSIGRNPKDGQRANLSAANLVGARGECVIKIEVAEQGALKGKKVNRVHYYVWNTTGPTKAIVPKPEDQEPDNIPF